jgi:MOSC domain-containing protein YiiM
VLREGDVHAGARLRRIHRLSSEWTIAAANEVMHRRKHDAKAARALAACPGLSLGWRESLARRVSTGTAEDDAESLEEGG